MKAFPPTLILRHSKEKLTKCSLYGLEQRNDLHFISYPWKVEKPDLSDYIVLALDGERLSEEDAHKGIFLIDGTWRQAKKMRRTLEGPLCFRSLPSVPTAYPRRQEVKDGLASIEALYLTYLILGRDPKGLLDHYYWKENFLTNMQSAFPIAHALQE